MRIPQWRVFYRGNVLHAGYVYDDHTYSEIDCGLFLRYHMFLSRSLGDNFNMSGAFKPKIRSDVVASYVEEE